MWFVGGLVLGLILGIVASRLWPTQTLVADTAIVRGEFARMEQGLIASVGTLHEKFDKVLAGIKQTL